MQQKKTPKSLSFRLNILFLVTFVLFSALVFRLGFLQIVHGEEYREMTERQNAQRISVEAPRGWMLDRNGEVLVYNTPVYTLTYTETFNINNLEIEVLAQNLAQHIDMEPEDIKARLARNEGLSHTIKRGLTFKEVSQIQENLESLPGIDVIVDPEREYRYDNLFKSFLGSVGNISAEDWGYYASRGYRMNEKVGRSYLEEHYEEQLRGTEGTIEIPVDRQQRPLGEPELTPGQRGNDLVLTIDLELQQAIEESIQKLKEDFDNVNDAFFVAMDPHTGEILGMSNDVRTVGAGRTSFASGSTVKMATTLMGLHEGLVTETERINDTEITIGNIRKSSWKNLGPVNAYQAIQQSSNVYMFRIGLRLINEVGLSQAFDTAYNYFSQFGLGVETGIDLPNGVEFDGYKSSRELPGLLVDYMIGQYHNYTPLQLAQYVSTIANGGYRMQPYLVKEIRREATSEDELGQVVTRREPKVLNRIDMSDEHIEMMQQGMEMVTEPGGTASDFADFKVKVAGKTGTAQTEDRDLNNTLFVGYAPADNPQIAFASVVPKSQETWSGGERSPHARIIAREILESYFGVKEEE
ncbi:peptidoglycan D,D-transpeptidase FtsI family protein [Caldalkalibacillus salinus]|uniref:peptidoglycan D,D-transpeptidase FtsI family protein n=1 Tax=Caldalkalibacillus salinus TaxID=2803787 RepID=UPI00192307C0|nr:penicillin-binding protein 2 [Caldalkalibacillus salinus]